jgi:hypothetical protein
MIYYAFMSTNREKIERAIREALASFQEGLRYSELVRYIKEKHPEIKENTIHGALHNLREKIRSGDIKDIVIPERGLFRLVREENASKASGGNKRAGPIPALCSIFDRRVGRVFQGRCPWVEKYLTISGELPMFLGYIDFPIMSP